MKIDNLIITNEVETKMRSYDIDSFPGYRLSWISLNIETRIDMCRRSQNIESGASVRSNC